MKAKFSNVGIRVKDLKASIDFYIGLLGMIVLQKVRFDQNKGEAVVLQSPEGGLILELNHY